jgi:hypothetical protein
MPNNWAPIGLSTYRRLDHLKETVQALKKNKLANESELYVFSDAPRLGDEEKVAAVREYLRTIDGFKAIHILERTENNRVANNRGGMRLLLDKYGKMIFLEEDVVTAPGFLDFMNTALIRYKDDKRVFSVTGWCPNFENPPPLEKGSTFFVPRFCGWGMGIWKDRYDTIERISVDDIKVLQRDRDSMERINKQMGSDIFAMLKAEATGKINALDIRCCYRQAITGELSLYPYPSLVKNIGLDGSGEHCGTEFSDINGEFEDKTGVYSFPQDVAVDKEVAKAYTDVFIIKNSLSGRIKKIVLRIVKKAIQPLKNAFVNGR